MSHHKCERVYIAVLTLNKDNVDIVFESRALSYTAYMLPCICCI